MRDHQPELRRELSFIDGVAIVAGTIIGSGIFLLPSSVAVNLHSLAAVLAVWGLGGVLSVFGAMSLGELGSVFPETGGIGTYLRHIYGPLPSFLYAWEMMIIIHSGSIAAVAVAFGLFAAQIVPLGVGGAKLVSVAMIAGLTIISCIGIRSGKLVQNTIAAAKLGGLAIIILLLLARGTHPLHLAAPAGASPFTLRDFGIALIAVLFAYEGWHLLSFVGGEMKHPQRDLPRSLVVGTGLVLAIYILGNLGYYHVLTPQEIRGTNALAAYAVGRLLGPVSTAIISGLILTSIVGTLNGLVLTGPRVYHAAAREASFPALFGRTQARFRTPMAALIIQGIWSAILAATGTYQQLFTAVIFTGWMFYGMAVAGVIVVRRRRPELPRPYSVPGYPWVPLAFCAAATGVAATTIAAHPLGALVALGLLGAGIPVHFALARAAQRGAAAAAG